MSEISEILEYIDPEFILEREGVDYKIMRGSSGEQVNLKECPFCGGDDYKVYLNRDTGLGNCFHGSCQETFNKYKLIKQLIGAPSNFVVRAYIQQLGNELGYIPKKKKSVAVNIETETKLPQSLELPTKDGQNLHYLEDRGVTCDDAKYFHLRYCESGWHEYPKSDGSIAYMDFSERIIIPVFNLEGDLVTFQGRDITGEKPKKYLFPSGLPGTSRFLYNGQNAAGKKRVVLVEGAFDVFRVHAVQKGSDFADVVPIGSFGMHLSHGGEADQVGAFYILKKHGLEEVYVMWDGEEKAYKKALQAGRLLLKVGLRVHICTLPKDKDAGECDRKMFLKAMKEATEINERSVVKLMLRKIY